MHCVSVCRDNPDTENINTYIYMDLSVDYVRYMSENLPEVFSVSGFQNCGKEAIKARNMSQLAYFRNSSGIFTMGRWIAKDLVERSGIPENKVYPVGGYKPGWKACGLHGETGQ